MPARDPQQARQLLRELAAQPEALAPVERAVMLVELAQLDRELGLIGRQRALQADRLQQRRPGAHWLQPIAACRPRSTRMPGCASSSRTAQAKLDAIANIERNLTERKPTTEGHQQ